ncbi:MAG: MarR family transcriptional regulator [Pseudomonadales bacterium]|nr:MarR family transcriptional regulator [Pseudomonadales bacterium]
MPIKINERELLRLENQLCFQIYTASRVMTQAYKPFLKALGLTYPQYLLMMVLWQKQGELEDAGTMGLAQSSVMELGSRLRLDSGTLSPLLKRMEAQGLLSRQRNAEDERQLQVVLTDKGINLSIEAVEVPLKLLCELDMPAEELWALKLQLEQLIVTIDD